MFNLNSQVVLVTGAAGNLGQAVARAFRAAGAKLVLADRANDRLPRIYPELISAPNVFLAHPYDIADPASARALVQRARERYGKIDVLANTIGGYKAGTPLEETPIEVLDEMFSLNARTVFLISQAVIPGMLQQGYGRIIHVSGKAGLAGSANSSAYSAAKAAVIRMVESMAAELKDKGINVNCVLPGTIDTPQNREAMPKADPSRWVTPEAIADVFLFLASPASRSVTGAAIPVTGKG